MDGETENYPILTGVSLFGVGVPYWVLHHWFCPRLGWSWRKEGGGWIHCVWRLLLHADLRLQVKFLISLTVRVGIIEDHCTAKTMPSNIDGRLRDST